MYSVKRPRVGVVSRKIPTDLVINTVFGKEVVKILCTTCGKTKLKSEYYIESKSKRKDDSQVRSQCILCWDKFKGRNPPETSEVSNTVIMFCEEAF